MSSASSTSARSLFVESKNRLADKVKVNVNNIASVVRQIKRGSKSNELLMQAAKQFAQQEKLMENTEMNVKKFQSIVTHLKQQETAMEESLFNLMDLNDKTDKLQKTFFSRT